MSLLKRAEVFLEKGRGPFLKRPEILFLTTKTTQIKAVFAVLRIKLKFSEVIARLQKHGGSVEE